MDLRLFDVGGELRIEVSGLCLERVGQREGLRSDEELLYQLDWRPLGDVAVDGAPASEAGDWLVFAGGGKLPEELAAQVAARGRLCWRVEPARRYGVFQQELRFTIDPAEPEHYRRLLTDFQTCARAGRPEVVFLWGLDGPVGPGSVSAGGPIAALLHAIQTAAELDAPPRLWVVTRGAQPAGGGGVPAPGQAPLWGLARAFGHQEHPELWGGVIDLDPAAPPEEARLLCEHIQSPGGEDQVAFRDGGRHAPRLLCHVPPAGAPKVRFRGDASYLITGGLGALGLRVARWMVALGARRLILMGRTGLPPRSNWRRIPQQDPLWPRIAAIRELEAAGGSVHLATVDVADEGELRSFLEDYEAEVWPPVLGVVHAAGVLDDRLLSRMDIESLERVLRPKVLGAWALHRFFAERPLDFFVLFSSLSSLLVPPGQGSYAAANAFLDALAHHRRALGLPALSIGWGPWAESGMAARQEPHPTEEDRSVAPIEPERALHLLERVIAGEEAQVVVAAADWERVRTRFYLGTSTAPLLADLVVPAPSAAPAGPRGTGARRAGIESSLHEMAARVLRINSSQLDPLQPLSKLGLDSIMAVELRAGVERSLGITLPMKLLLDAPSVNQLATRLARHLGQESPS